MVLLFDDDVHPVLSCAKNMVCTMHITQECVCTDERINAKVIRRRVRDTVLKHYARTRYIHIFFKFFFKYTYEHIDKEHIYIL